jgi:hypothetical protein
MTSRNRTLFTLILVLVVAVAAWSKLRFVGREGYDAPQRWRVEEFSMPKAAPLPTVEVTPAATVSIPPAR